MLCAKKIMGESAFSLFTAPKNVSVKRTLSVGNIFIYILQKFKIVKADQDAD